MGVSQFECDFSGLLTPKQASKTAAKFRLKEGRNESKNTHWPGACFENLTPEMLGCREAGKC